RSTPSQQDLRRIRHPIGPRNQHLIAGIQQYHGHVIQRLLRPAGDDDLFWGVVQVILAFELAGDSLTQGWQASGWRILGKTLCHGVLSGTDDVAGRGKVWLSEAK